MGNTLVKVKQTATYKVMMIGILAVVCVLATMVCVSIGSVSYTIPEIIEALWNPEAKARLIIWNVRFPRVVCGGLVGICLSLAGCILQGVMRNHMASPSTIGVTSGASFVGYIALVAFPQLSKYLPVGTIFGAFATTMAIYALAYEGIRAADCERRG